MPDKTKTSVDTASVDVAETLEELHQVTEITELDTSGVDAGPLGQVHPVGWTVIGLLVVAVVFHLLDTEWLIGNFAWWHWVGLIALAAVSLRPGPIKAVSRSIDKLTNFFESGANSFERPWAGFVGLLCAFGLAGLFIGPLRGLADTILGVDVVDVGGGDFEVTSNSSGWITTGIAAVVIAALLFAIVRAAAGVVPEGEISIPTGAKLAIATFFITLLLTGLLASWSTGITTGFALGVLVAGLALGPLWTLGWGIFVTIFFYVVTSRTGPKHGSTICFTRCSWCRSCGRRFASCTAMPRPTWGSRKTSAAKPMVHGRPAGTSGKPGSKRPMPVTCRSVRCEQRSMSASFCSCSKFSAK